MPGKLSPKKTAAKTAKFKATMARKRAGSIPLDAIPDRPKAAKVAKPDIRLTVAVELVKLAAKLLA